MFLIKTKRFSPSGFNAITIWPFIFYRKTLSKTVLNHERIHARQQVELLIIIFYLIYLIEYLFKGYNKISFEKEAYKNENNTNYLKNRKLFAMWRK